MTLLIQQHCSHEQCFAYHSTSLRRTGGSFCPVIAMELALSNCLIRSITLKDISWCDTEKIMRILVFLYTQMYYCKTSSSVLVLLLVYVQSKYALQLTRGVYYYSTEGEIEADSRGRERAAHAPLSSIERAAHAPLSSIDW